MSKTTSDAVLVDTSVWIGAHRGKLDVARLGQLQEALREGRAAMSPAIWLELLIGFRSSLERRQIGDIRDACVWLATPEALWEKAETIAGALHRRGVILRLADLLIFCTARAYGAKLLHCDSDFDAALKLDAFAGSDV